jgi:hypothetical protein
LLFHAILSSPKGGRTLSVEVGINLHKRPVGTLIWVETDSGTRYVLQLTQPSAGKAIMVTSSERCHLNGDEVIVLGSSIVGGLTESDPPPINHRIDVGKYLIVSLSPFAEDYWATSKVTEINFNGNVV